MFCAFNFCHIATPLMKIFKSEFLKPHRFLKIAFVHSSHVYVFAPDAMISSRVISMYATLNGLHMIS